MLASIIKVKKVAANANLTLGAGTLLHGVNATSTSLSLPASVTIHDAATAAASNPVMIVVADETRLGVVQGSFGLMLPYPVKCGTGVSVSVTNCEVFVYYS